MPQPINKITQFWNELKRRKVVRVIIVDTATAFNLCNQRIVSGIINIKEIPLSNR